ncbi:MAG: hypothetical protein ACD_30C00034G0002 [uncultured bacterium]|uniref:Uncharacterized protein n=4 Tax=Candidatus Daviesiibacteriota TaxID=1752718 RepID=A0A0G0ELB2_9BACT|nr:MAG: hypothetical protein ACD_30C00034G0002 [uncultured bacterium]KKQ07843.1 MAG: hypothetical protein US19_C0036G0002 [Candidatus Daviesbacteria bacterium GW2011_GWB1_36_5]KKQ14266.1 MAG: hypothetical protein US28_C0037G0007 [Candidatus Daviesbacteria bacterium GW2011_GWA1_36_8]OGE16819.1 MAG: hypothetical protein A2858_02855 [Candidatus Daviesbacteria bacterium RIFCSPHIGHO2_01_FULL_36_37]OGE31178.1 MAG: hypothetical protein A3C99_00830 [Candidatus Daviesbacteria bacterium RIFCSPHIGHO2_02_F
MAREMNGISQDIQKIETFTDQLSTNKHYSEKGGHQARGFWWRDIRRIYGGSTDVTPKDFSWMQRRKMPRNPSDGKH